MVRQQLWACVMLLALGVSTAGAAPVKRAPAAKARLTRAAKARPAVKRRVTVRRAARPAAPRPVVKRARMRVAALNRASATRRVGRRMPRRILLAQAGTGEGAVLAPANAAIPREAEPLMVRALGAYYVTGDGVIRELRDRGWTFGDIATAGNLSARSRRPLYEVARAYEDRRDWTVVARDMNVPSDDVYLAVNSPRYVMLRPTPEEEARIIAALPPTGTPDAAAVPPADGTATAPGTTVSPNTPIVPGTGITPRTPTAPGTTVTPGTTATPGTVIAPPAAETPSTPGARNGGRGGNGARDRDRAVPGTAPGTAVSPNGTATPGAATPEGGATDPSALPPPMPTRSLTPVERVAAARLELAPRDQSALLRRAVATYYALPAGIVRELEARGWTLGDILTAGNLAHRSEASLEEVVALRDTGEEWSSIASRIGVASEDVYQPTTPRRVTTAP